MSYFVIKGPRGANQYLCARVTFPEHETPQWWFERSKAQRFPDEESAWDWLALVASSYPSSGEWSGRVVRVNTLRDWKAERAMLRQRIAEVEVHRDLKEGIIKMREAEIKRLTESNSTKGLQGDTEKSK